MLDIIFMRKVNLRSVDLNLLVVLQALLDEASVTRAAERVSMSQPAVSRALSRLRLVFDDPLLVKTGGKMVLTKRASELVAPLHRLLADAESLVIPASFEPSTAQGEFRVAATDGAILLVLKKLVANVARIAPDIKFVISSTTTYIFDALKADQLDLAVDIFTATPGDFHSSNVLVDKPVCIARKQHPSIKKELTKSAYLKASHIKILTGTSPIIQKSLEDQGAQRRISLEISSFITAAALVAETDWLLTLPSIQAQLVKSMFPIEIYKVPFEIKLPPLLQIWHERNQHDLKHQWIRRQLASVMKMDIE
jgi:DNA-binding transcriptional LysR family regulator